MHTVAVSQAHYDRLRFRVRRCKRIVDNYMYIEEKSGENGPKTEAMHYHISARALTTVLVV